MMAFNTWMNRNEAERRKLLEDTGLKMMVVWQFADRDGLVEAEVAT